MPEVKKRSSAPAAAADARAGVVAVAGMPDRVWASVGVTLNLGDYQSARVDVGMASDLRPGEKERDAMDRIFGFIEREMASHVAEIRSSFGLSPKGKGGR